MRHSSGWYWLLVGWSVGTAAAAQGRKLEAELPRRPAAQSSDVLMQRPITVDIIDVSLSDALLAVAKAGKIRLLYQMELVKTDRPVSLKVTNAPLGRVLDRLLQDTRLRATAIDSATISIEPAMTDTAGKAATVPRGGITGRVTDSATGLGIGGATVGLPGTKVSTLTLDNGSFRLEGVMPGEHELSVKLFGFKPVMQKVTVVSGRHVTVRVVLVPAATKLTEVVTTVTGEQRKREFGNDVTTINVEEVMKQAPITSVTDLLEARVPGLTVMRTSGIPGAPSRIRLRGIGGGLLSGVSGAPTNDPIVIVDGIRIHASQSGVDDQRLGGGEYPTPSPIDQIDPNSIEKIEVLKGPSASAMYGADAADGVIIVTTKKGRAGPVRWNINGSTGVQYMPGVYAKPGYYRFCSGLSGSINQQIEWRCPQLGSGLFAAQRVDSVVRFQALDVPRLSTIGRGYDNTITATASGGSQTLAYSLTGSMSQSLGMTRMPQLYQDVFARLYDSVPSKRMRRPNTNDAKGGTATFSGDIGTGLNAVFTTSLSQSAQHQSSANSQLSSLASVYIDTLNIDPAVVGEYAYQLTTWMLTSNNVLALNVSRWSFIPVTATIGVNRNERKAEGLTPRGILSSPSDGLGASYTTKGSFTERHEYITRTTSRVTATVLPHARIVTAIGAELARESNAAIGGNSDTLVPGVSRPSVIIGGTRSGRNRTTGGWFLEPRLNVNSRFFVNPGFRFDGSGVSGSRSGFRGGLMALFPKMNFSWVALDREGGEPLWGVLSLVRPRLAFGIAGVQPAAEWSLRTLEQYTGPWSPALEPVAPDLGLRLRSAGNTQLGPEKTREVEGGFDIQLLDTRFTLSVTHYYKMRKDAIERLPLAPSIGTTSDYFANIGHIRNTGTELTLNANILDLPAVSWNVDISLSRYTNKLVRLHGERPYIDLGDGTRLVEGFPLFGRWSRPILGWTEPIDGLRLRYADIAVADSAVYMGMQAPDFEMPFSTGLTLMRGLFSINAQFNYKSGLTQYNLGGKDLLGNIYENPQSSRAAQTAALAAACFEPRRIDPSGKPCTDFGFIQTVNSLRFNSMSISYTLPRPYLKRLPFSSMTFALQGSNLGLWSSYRGKDPDVNGSLVGDVTRDAGQLPMPRTGRFQIRLGT